jgi:hypothetical protein
VSFLPNIVIPSELLLQYPPTNRQEKWPPEVGQILEFKKEIVSVENKCGITVYVVIAHSTL